MTLIDTNQHELVQIFLLKRQWDAYRAAAIARNCPESLQKELRRAFYFGAGAFQIVLANIVADEAEDSAEHEQTLLMVVEELDAFLRDVEAGRA